ncbi:hypothetical protein [Kibdelosporangium phytohabitans]|uniref:NTP pyrophosphohydrolase MazG putative catalytic core domain-containing protein n=1 Tax=Kibdelosporangium phytohabitans TaxID=860235 RepID=A0A0N9ICN9_9PSEU|nr:hypothetical protein [Kibdelosporangium phytohabitans]ALG12747.1 hypothetical protein AOZ06_43105 [Kibdelosporangium phytohabitans]MBE1464421.1 hypothetical protein [Kibdelosporangium phytohabitans]
MKHLGPFQDLWDAWDEADEAIRAKPLYHFELAVGAQFDELRGHLAADLPGKAANEAVAIISVALNLLRRLGYTPDEVAELTRARAADRMRGQTSAILDKYRRQFGV